MTVRPQPLPVHTITPRDGAPGSDLIAVEAVGQPDMERPPHRHRFAQLVIVEAGTGNHLVDFAPVPIRRGDIHILAPGQVHSWDATGLSGRALMFDEELLDGTGVLPERIRELILLGAAPLQVSADARRRVNRLFDAAADTVSAEAARHLVTALLWECIHGSVGPAAERRHSSLTGQFMEQVLRDPSARHTVTAHAAQLGVTTGYLTETVVADTGSTPGRILRAAVVREAQRLLSGTTLTAAQISARLGFSEASYFSRFFHREVGCTPTAYRTMPSRHTNTI